MLKIRFDSPMMIKLGKLADQLVLNLLFVLCCLPVVTIGAATTALFAVAFRRKKQTDGIAKIFWQAFKADFKISTAAWLLLATVFVLAGLDFRFIGDSALPARGLLLAVVLIVEVLLAVELLYIFAYIAKFDNTLKQSLINALVIGIASFPSTLLLVVMYVAFALVIAGTGALGGVIALFGGFVVGAYTIATVYQKVFAKQIQKARS